MVVEIGIVEAIIRGSHCKSNSTVQGLGFGMWCLEHRTDSQGASEFQGFITIRIDVACHLYEATLTFYAKGRAPVP